MKDNLPSKKCQQVSFFDVLCQMDKKRQKMIAFTATINFDKYEQLKKIFDQKNIVFFENKII